MQLENRFTVPVPAEDAWRILLDVRRVAPCLPGATLGDVDGDEFTGNVKVKVGPVMLTYKGQARFAQRDDAARSVVIEAAGRETRGSGTAAATVTARLTELGGTTEVHVVTDLNVTGKPAQFGRGVLVDLSTKLIDQFAQRLAAEVQAGGGAEPVPDTTPTSPQPAEAIDLLSTAGLPAAKRFGPVLVVAVVALLVLLRVRRQ